MQTAFCLLLLVALATSAELNGIKRTKVLRKRQAGGGCVYEGKTYQQGQTWQVPCKYNCQCNDGQTGTYRCTEICPHYDNLPNGCYMVKEPNSCCSKPQCNFQTSGSGQAGQGQVISGQSGMGQVSGGGSSSCQDTIPNCKDYGSSVCTNSDYRAWVKEKCASFCNACGGSGMTSGGSVVSGSGGMSGGMSGGGSGTASGVCADSIPNCSAYGQQVCSDQQYAQWVQQNCKKFCNACGSSIVISGGSGSGTNYVIPGYTGEYTGTGTGGGLTLTGGSVVSGGSYPSSGGTGTGSGGSYPNTGGTGGTGGSYPNTGGTGETGGSYPNTGGTGGTGGSYPNTGSGGSYPNTGSGGTGTGTGGSYPNTGSGGTGTVPGGTGTLSGGTYPNTGSGGTYPNTGSEPSEPPEKGVRSGARERGTYPNTGSGGIGTDTGGTGSGSGGTYPNTGSGGTYYPSSGGTGTGGTGTGGTGSGSGGGSSGGSGGGDGGFSLHFTNGGDGGGSSGGSGGTSGSGTCTGDNISDCKNYGVKVCTDPKYASWVAANCCMYCLTGGGTSSGMGTGGMGTGGSGQYVGGNGGSQYGTGSNGGGISGSSSGCVYKGKIYQQGQEWNDGCSFHCSCTDGPTGRYTCKQLCVQWNLPNVCTLNNPAPGKCCKTPNCPSTVQITYPQGYVEY